MSHQNCCASSGYTSELSFKDAVKLYGRAWRKKRRSTVPEVSHALSTLSDEGTYSLASSETGEQLCNVHSDGNVTLVEDFSDTTVDNLYIGLHRATTLR